MRIDGDMAKQFIGTSRKIEKRAKVSARIAVNLAARKGRTIASKLIRQNVAFPASYVNERVKVVKKATNENPTALIIARSRPTQLIRFATPTSITNLKNRKKKQKASIKVKKKGGRKRVDAFYVGNLKNNNQGLAVREKGTFPGTGKPKFRILYSTSVNQAFTDLLDDVTAQTNQIMRAEFNRQMERLK